MTDREVYAVQKLGVTIVTAENWSAGIIPHDVADQVLDEFARCRETAGAHPVDTMGLASVIAHGTHRRTLLDRLLFRTRKWDAEGWLPNADHYVLTYVQRVVVCPPERADDLYALYQSTPRDFIMVPN